MQANSIICTGSSRFLNNIYGASESLSGTLTIGGGNATEGKYSTLEYNKFILKDPSNATMTIQPTDITLQSPTFWDGTNTSLKSALATASGKVTQTSTTTSANYEVLFSGTADNTTRTEGARKSSTFIFNPSKKGIIVGDLATNTSLGSHANAFGTDITASGDYSHAEGNATTASGESSHAEGDGSTASGDWSHAEGNSTTANYEGSHAEGNFTTADAEFSHAEGSYTTTDGSASHAEGAYTTASGSCSHAEGYTTTASGDWSHAEGSGTTANHKSQHVFGEYNIEDTSTATAASRGNYVEIVGNGTGSTAKSNARTLDWSGNECLQRSLTVGTRTANSTYGLASLAVGSGHTCSGKNSVAEGNINTVTGNHSHAEGYHTTVDTDFGHAEGQYTTASGYYCHVEGDHTIANHNSQHVFGAYNIADPSTTSGAGKGNYIEIVGNGTSSTRANARTLNWSGNEWIAGTLTQGSSIEIKKNVADMTQEDGDKILNLRPVVFDYKSSEKDIQAERGFIAEEVAEVIPNLVTEKIINQDGDTVAPASLNYIAMIPYLVKVCQRQQEEIDRLKSLIAEK